MDDLPDIDAVLISHNHYDHLDLRTLRQIAARGRSTFIVAASGARLLRSEKIEPVHELDWGESLTLSGFKVHCVPALHFSARGILDRNKTLWCGSTIPLLMLCALLKLGVLKPAGASVADFAATLTSPAPKAATAAKRQEHRRTFLQWGLSMSVPPKDTVAYVDIGRKLTDLLTSIPQSREPVENCGLKSEVL